MAAAPRRRSERRAIAFSRVDMDSPFRQQALPMRGSVSRSHTRFLKSNLEAYARAPRSAIPGAQLRRRHNAGVRKRRRLGQEQARRTRPRHTVVSPERKRWRLPDAEVVANCQPGDPHTVRIGRTTVPSGASTSRNLQVAGAQRQNPQLHRMQAEMGSELMLAGTAMHRPGAFRRHG